MITLRFSGRLRRLAMRVFYKLAMFALRPVESLDARLYMRLATPVLRSIGVVFAGSPRYVSSRAYFDDGELVTVGDRCVISRDVILLTHDYSVTTAMLAANRAPQRGDVAATGSIHLGSNVFVGFGAILLPGTWIGDNVVVGAGSVVRGRHPGDSVIAGNPAGVVSTIHEHYEKVSFRMSEPRGFRQDA